MEPSRILAGVMLTFVCTILAMLAFAANSLLARAALADGAIDAVSFTTIRFLSGTLTLAVLIAIVHGRRSVRTPAGNWPSALCLLAYGLGFSLAYLRLGAATGALILFAAVQAGMIGWGVYRGQRPSPGQTAGLAIAFVAFVVLMAPGLHAPDLLGSVLMMVAGFAWAAYSLRGRGSADPLAETGGNMLRTTLLCLPISVVCLADWRITAPGLLLATIAGSMTSGVGYAIWYRALDGLKPIQAASVQLTVPLIAAVGAVTMLAEAPSARLVVTGGVILLGVGLTILCQRRAS